MFGLITLFKRSFKASKLKEDAEELGQVEAVTEWDKGSHLEAVLGTVTIYNHPSDEVEDFGVAEFNDEGEPEKYLKRAEIWADYPDRKDTDSLYDYVETIASDKSQAIHSQLKP